MPNILKFLFPTTSVIIIIICAFLFSPSPAQADITFTQQVAIPGVDVSTISNSSVGIYIKGIYKYLIGIVGILATLVMMFGGVLWLTAGSSDRVKEGQEWIKSSLIGLLIALFSFVILATVNPELTKMKSLNINGISQQSQAATCSGRCTSDQCNASTETSTSDRCDNSEQICCVTKSDTSSACTSQGGSCQDTACSGNQTDLGKCTGDKSFCCKTNTSTDCSSNGGECKLSTLTCGSKGNKSGFSCPISSGGSQYICCNK